MRRLADLHERSSEAPPGMEKIPDAEWAKRHRAAESSLSALDGASKKFRDALRKGGDLGRMDMTQMLVSMAELSSSLGWDDIADTINRAVSVSLKEPSPEAS